MKAMANYFGTLERRLDCPSDVRRDFLAKTRRTAEEFLQEKPEATQQDLADYLGEPQELAQGFLETLEPDALERYHRRKKFLLRGCIAALIVALMAVTTWGIYVWNVPMNVEIVETTTIIYHNSQLGEETS